MPPTPTARSLHLYAAALVSRRPWRLAVDEHAPPAVASLLRHLGADLLRCIFPDARRWRSLPDPRKEPPQLTVLARLGDGWGDASLRALAAIDENDAAEAGAAASRLSRVAEAARFRLTAAVFAEAAALADWENPKGALRVATLARDRADHPAAEWWGRRAARLATRCGDRINAARGWARVADSYYERGDHRKALTARRREYQEAKLSRDRDLSVRAAHSLLFSLHFAGKSARVWRLVPSLIHRYPADHPRLPKLAHDLAWLRMEQGDAATALRVFRGLSAFIPEADRLTLDVNHARAAAEMGDWDDCKTAEIRALNALERSNFADGAGWALSVLAETAAKRGEWEMARSRARAASRVAEARGEAESLARALRVLEQTGRR